MVYLPTFTINVGKYILYVDPMGLIFPYVSNAEEDTEHARRADSTRLVRKKFTCSLDGVKSSWI